MRTGGSGHIGLGVQDRLTGVKNMGWGALRKARLIDWLKVPRGQAGISGALSQIR